VVDVSSRAIVGWAAATSKQTTLAQHQPNEAQAITP
jgi:transposase InsO family protein